MSEFAPSPQQAAAIRAIVGWYSNPNRTTQVFRLFGYAGSGKSTITRYVIEQLGLKRFIAGRGNADKAAVIAAVRARGYSPVDDNEADAIAILLWALETQGGVR